MNRSESLLNLSLDYDHKDQVLQGFTKLASVFTGSDYSQLNLIDENNQWTVAAHGMEFPHISNDVSICYITINNEDVFEIKDFTEDERFKNHPLVTGEPFLRYYLGFPIYDRHDVIIGTICLLHTEEINLTEQQLEFFQIIRVQISSYLEQLREKSEQSELINTLKSKAQKVRHDIRTPLSGVIGFASLIEKELKDEKLINKITLIKESSKELLDYAEKSLRTDLEGSEEQDTPKTHIKELTGKLKALYATQSQLKQISLNFKDRTDKSTVIQKFSKNDVTNIIGNVVSNAIKFSEVDNRVDIIFSETDEFVEVLISDEGSGIASNTVTELNALTYKATQKHQDSKSGFGIGLVEALKLLKSRHGQFHIESALNKGTNVALLFPKGDQT